MPRKILDYGSIAVWQVGDDFPVYDGQKLLRTCPSMGMAREVAEGARVAASLATMSENARRHGFA